MVSMLDPTSSGLGSSGLGSSGLGSSPRSCYCIVLLGKTTYPHNASLHPGTYEWIPANLMLLLSYYC